MKAMFIEMEEGWDVAYIPESEEELDELFEKFTVNGRTDEEIDKDN